MRLPWGGPKTTTIGGRRWKPIGPTSINHDAATTKLALELGFFETLAEGEDETAFLARVGMQVNASGRIAEVLGYTLLPAEKDMEDWTPELAAETSAFLGSRSSPADREKLQPLLQQGLLHFFLIGRRSLATSRSSSAVASQSLASALQLLRGLEPTGPGRS